MGEGINLEKERKRSSLETDKHFTDGRKRIEKKIITRRHPKESGSRPKRWTAAFVHARSGKSRFLRRGIDAAPLVPRDPFPSLSHMCVHKMWPASLPKQCACVCMCACVSTRADTGALSCNSRACALFDGVGAPFFKVSPKIDPSSERAASLQQSPPGCARFCEFSPFDIHRTNDGQLRRLREIKF